MTEHNDGHNDAQHGARNGANHGAPTSAPLLGGAGEFCTVVLGARPGVVCLAFGRGPRRTATGTYGHLEWQEMHYSWPADRDLLLADVAREIAVAPVDVYVCPAIRHPGARARRKGDALPPLVCWVDLDGVPADPELLATLHRLGAFTVRSGTGAHRHVYLPLSRPVGVATHAALNQALAARLGGDAKWSDETLLRLPGTPNWKPTAPASGQPGGQPVLVTAEPHNGRRVDPDELAALLNLDLSATGAHSGPLRVADTPAVAPQPAPEVLPEVVARALADPDTADRSRAIARVIAACVTAGLSVGQSLTVITGYGPATRYTQPRHMAADVARFYAKVTAGRAGGHNAAPPDRHPPAAPASVGRTGGPAPTAPTNGHQVIAPPAEPDDRSPEPLAFPEPLGPHDPTGPDTRRSGATANGSANDAPGTERGGERPGDQDDTGDAHDDGHDGATGVGAGGVTSDETGDGGGDAPTADHGGEGEASQADDGPDLHMLAATVFQLSGDVSCLNTRLGEVEDQVISHAATFDDLERLGAAVRGRAEPRGSEPAQPATPDAAIEPAVEPTGQRAASEEEPETGGLDMRALVRWVGDNVAALLERRSPQSGGWPYWCRAWWMHPEAIARFEAARRCWAEAVTGEGAAMVVYFEHLDAMLAVLCAENGPFCSCTDGQHRADGSHTGARILGQDWPPEDYYTSLAAPLDPADVHAHGAGSGAAARPDRSGPDDALAGVAGGGGFGEVGSAGGCQLTAAHRPAEARRRADTR